VQKLDKSRHFVESEIEFAIANCSEKVQITTKMKLSVKDSFVSFSVQSFGRPFLKLCEVRGDRDLGRDGLSSSPTVLQLAPSLNPADIPSGRQDALVRLFFPQKKQPLALRYFVTPARFQPKHDS
jgi:hypothetical protein